MAVVSLSEKSQLWDMLYSEGVFERIPVARYQEVREIFENVCAKWAEEAAGNRQHMHMSILRSMVAALTPMRDLSDPPAPDEEVELDMLLARAKAVREEPIPPAGHGASADGLTALEERVAKLEMWWKADVKSRALAKCPYV